ncbi:hypothetical protein HUU61_11805 [Rhodopseudomonas palustris]|uniref:Uncharacterized protein n=1 Tax=Thiospirillum jenense TaxID=1653858 RepID=A0A839HG77_9GAMM|nr:hypothetical protein [Thiospirillum jenense]MBB1091976.1 hypothetical protein [Rhodopseudomonas palustris]MBB1126306.1 hypothetical protein [Thiospirillum jenense]
MATVPIVAAAATDSTVGATYEMGFADGYNQGVSAGRAAGAGECATNPTGCGITFAALAASRSWYGETEANDNIVSADPLALDQGFLAQSYAAEDQDWFYVVTTAQNTNLTLNFSMPSMAVGSLAGWVISIRDAIGMPIAEFNTGYTSVADARVGMDYYVTLGLKGTYYVVVKPAPDALNYNQYQVKAHLEAAANTDPNFVVGFYDAETEPNNDPTVADVITKGVSMYGLINLMFNGVVAGDPSYTWGQGEDDWYVYESPGNEIVRLSFCDREYCSAGNWSVQIFDENGIERTDVSNYVDACNNPVNPPPADGCGGVLPLLSYDEVALVTFNTTSCGASPCECDVDCRPVPEVWNIGLEHAGKYYMRVNHQRRIEAPCAAFALDTDNNGVLNNDDRVNGVFSPCGCASGYSCDITVLNPNITAANINCATEVQTITDANGETTESVGTCPPCSNGTGGGNEAQCNLGCGCAAYGSVVQLPLWDDAEANSVYTSQYNYSWTTNPRGSEITTPSNSTINTDAYTDYTNRPSAY